MCFQFFSIFDCVSIVWLPRKCGKMKENLVIAFSLLAIPNHAHYTGRSSWKRSQWWTTSKSFQCCYWEDWTSLHGICMFYSVCEHCEMHFQSIMLMWSEILSQGKDSSDEAELDETPDDDQYDTEDSFIDDAELVSSKSITSIFSLSMLVLCNSSWCYSSCNKERVMYFYCFIMLLRCLLCRMSILKLIIQP